MKRLLLAALIAGVALLLVLAGRDPAARAPTPPALHTADPQLFYLLRPGAPLTLPLAPGVARVKLVTSVQLPLEPPPDPARRIPYVVVAERLDDDGLVRETATIALTTRCSAEGPLRPGGGAPRRGAYVTSRDRELGDERSVELDVDDGTLAGGALRLSVPADATHSVLVRPYRRVRDPESRLRLTTLEDPTRRALAARVGVSAWSELSDDERSLLASFRWQRMEAAGARGRDYESARVVLTGLRIPAETSGGLLEDGVLEPGRGWAWNLQAPTAVELAVERAHGDDPRGDVEASAALALTQVAADGEVRVRRIELPADGPLDEAIELPGNTVQTLSLRNVGDVALRVDLFGDDEAPWAGTGSRHDVARGRPRLEPERRHTRRHRAGGEHGALEYALDGGRDRLRVEVRPVDGRAARVETELIDAEGRSLTRGTLSCAAGPAPFDDVRPAGTSDPWRPAGEPTTAELWTAAGATALRLHADVPVDVAVSVPLARGWEPSVAADTHQLTTRGVVLRNEPLRSRRWAALHPVPAGDGDGRAMVLRSQVRLAPPDGPPEPPERADAPTRYRVTPATRADAAWPVDGETQRQRLIEPDRHAGGAVPWADGTLVRMTPGEDLRVDDPGEATLTVWVDDAALLGQELIVSVDGRIWSRLPLTARQLELPLGALPGSRHTLRLDGPGSGLLALVDARPAAGGGPGGRYRARSVVRIDPGTPVQATIPVPATGEPAVVLRVYRELPAGRRGPRAGALGCRVTVDADGGRATATPYRATTPLALEGQLVPSTTEAGFLADRRDQRLLAFEPVVIPLGDDLAGQEVSVRVELPDGAPTAWIRLVTLDVPPPPAADGNQWLERGPPADGPWAWADPFEGAGPLRERLDDALADAQQAPLQAPAEALEPTRRLVWALSVAARDGALASLPALAAQADALGFSLEPRLAGDRRVLVLGAREADGRGLLALRFAGPAGEWFVQAPHVHHDRHTGRLAVRLLEVTSARALMVNTRHRHSAEHADLARREDTRFHAATLGLLDGQPRPLLVQLHGFGRETVPDPTIDVVLSAGRSPRGPAFEALAAALGAPGAGSGVAAGVARYPEDLARLGGLDNAQGRAVAARDGGAFLHLELGPELRDRLAADDAVFTWLATALDRAAAVHDDEGGTP